MTDKQKYEILVLDGKELGIARLTFFKRDDMAIATTQHVAEMLMKKIDILDSSNDINQIIIWKITEIFKNASDENIAVRISYSETKPLWVADNLLTGLLS